MPHEQKPTTPDRTGPHASLPLLPNDGSTHQPTVLRCSPRGFGKPFTLVSMTDILTITGLVATTPRHLTTAEGFAVTNFRLASSLRKFDKKTKEWVDSGTNWYTISSYRALSQNVLESVHKGDRVLVTGRLRIRDWRDGERSGTNVDLDADAIGHDLTWGTATYVRSISSSNEGDASDTNAEVAGSRKNSEPDFPSESDSPLEQNVGSAVDSAEELESVRPF